MRLIANDKAFGTLGWLRHHNEERIAAFFGSRSQRDAIGDWAQVTDFHLSDAEHAVRLNHGYDESRPMETLSIEDMRSAAEFRGGECLSEQMTVGDLRTPLKWRCACGHTFTASPTLILLGGHWCDKCLTTPWRYDEQAANNPFLAQVWSAMHPKATGENMTYGEENPKDYR